MILDRPAAAIPQRLEFHWRRLFLATCELMDAAVGRFAFVFDPDLFSPCLALLIVLGRVRDLAVDRRVHKVYLYALPASVIGQSLAVYMWPINPPWWRAMTQAILG